MAKKQAATHICSLNTTLNIRIVTIVVKRYMDLNKDTQPKIIIKSCVSNRILLRLNDTDSKSSESIQSPDK